MKRLIALLLVLTCTVILPLPSGAEFQKTKIAVLDFQLQGEGYETTDMGKIVAEWLITALVREGRFEVVERRLLQKILEEQKLVMAGVVDENSASQLGKLLGVKVIISGSVMRFQNIMEVNARIIDVESGSIITAENVKSTTAIKLEDLVVQMAEKIIKDFPLEGYIVNRSQDSVTIDLGKRAGVKNGMKFIVFKEGKIIKHPRTGEVLDVEKIETGEIEISSVTDNIATAKIVKETSPDAIKYAQMVKSVFESVAPVGRYKQPPLTGIFYEMAEVDPIIEEARQLKASGDPSWEIKCKEALAKLKPIYKRYPTSAEVFISYAKAYFVADSMRRVNKCFKKAVYYNPNNIEAYVMQGDMNYTYGVRIGAQRSRDYNLDKIAQDAYEAAARKSPNKDLQAMMYHKIGNIYDELSEKPEKAKEYWQKAVAIAPGSEAARLAGERLASSGPETPNERQPSKGSSFKARE
ncbi:MAG: FlgO family outer membrane protein [Pseudomonadota bacterium]